MGLLTRPSYGIHLPTKRITADLQQTVTLSQHQTQEDVEHDLLQGWGSEGGSLGWVWCVVVWCGVVWCGVVWCGVVWCGVVWCGVV